MVETSVRAGLMACSRSRHSGLYSRPAKTPLVGFKANDKDRDGKLNKSVYREMLKTLGFADQLETLFAQRDVNKDGLVSVDEYRHPIPQ